MANVNIDIVNPTGADVTSGGKTAKARNVTKLLFDNTVATDIFAFLAAGCGAVSFDAATVEQREQVGELMQVLANYAV